MASTDGTPAPRRPGAFEQSLEFLVVCDNYALLKTLTTVIHQLSGKLNCAPTAAAASGYINRRKLDGIVVDMQIAGALELIRTIRDGSSNKFSVVFTCISNADEAHKPIEAGANFVLHHPVTVKKVFDALSSASAMMLAERRRYFRYPLMVSIQLRGAGRESRGTISNLSESGMALWSLTSFPIGTNVQFEFDLPFGGRILGKGEVAWSNADGLMGVKFHMLLDSAYAHLSSWLSRREPGAQAK